MPHDFKYTDFKGILDDYLYNTIKIENKDCIIICGDFNEYFK